MKFSKKNCCENCVLKCDIHYTLIESGQTINSTDFLHVFLNRHEVICKQGAPVTHAIYLVKGSAKLYVEGLNHRNIILYILRPHSYIGLLSFFETPVYSYSVMALEDSQICMVELNFVKQLYLMNHDFLIKLNKAFGKSVAAIMSKVISLNQKHIRGRVAESLIYLSELNASQVFKLGLTRKEIGEMAGISEENAVRILSEFKKEEIIRLNGMEIEIPDMKILKRISELG
jgi:CRP-like cAMP-binding protein